MTADGVCRLTDLDRRAAGARRDDAVSTRSEGGDENPDDRRFVVDDEDKVAVSHDGPEG